VANTERKKTIARMLRAPDQHRSRTRENGWPGSQDANQGTEKRPGVQKTVIPMIGIASQQGGSKQGGKKLSGLFLRGKKKAGV